MRSGSFFDSLRKFYDFQFRETYPWWSFTIRKKIFSYSLSLSVSNFVETKTRKKRFFANIPCCKSLFISRLLVFEIALFSWVYFRFSYLEKIRSRDVLDDYLRGNCAIKIRINTLERKKERKNGKRYGLSCCIKQETSHPDSLKTSIGY